MPNVNCTEQKYMHAWTQERNVVIN